MIQEEQLVEHIECGQNSNGTRLETFIGSLVGILVDVPLRDFTYAVHLEAVTCLLILLSVQLHSNKRAANSTIYRIVMKGQHAIHSPFLVKNLLQNFIDQEKAPLMYGGNSNQSFVFGIATGLWSMITFNRKQVDGVEGSAGNEQDVPLSTYSLLLLLALTNHCTIQSNPYRQSLFTCANSEGKLKLRLLRFF